MGILLTFMFLMNMVGAMVLLPALASLFWTLRDKWARRSPSDEPVTAEE